MSDENDHVEVVLDDPKEEKKNDEPIVEVEKNDEKHVKAEEKKEFSAEEGIKELKRRLEIEKRRAEEAEWQAMAARERAERAEGDKSESQYQLVVNAIETVKERDKALQNAYAEAISVGDSAKAAEIVSAISMNNSQLERLKEGKKAMKRQMKDTEDGEQPKIVEQPRYVDPIDQMAQNVSPRSASWLRENRDSLRDERSIRRMYRAHEDAVDDGIAPDSDEYFSFIENRLGLNKSDDTDPVSEAAAPSPRRQVPPPAAPVSRGNQRPNVIRLSREQADTAKMMGMTEAEYAKNMIALRNEGKMGRQ